MTKEQIFDEINELIAQGNFLSESVWDSYIPGAEFYPWQMKIITLLEIILQPKNIYLSKINECNNTVSNCSKIITILNDIKFQIEKGIIVIKKNCKANNVNAIEGLTLLFCRFHKVVKQLRNRYSKRETLNVKDEYDVQDLLHSLLQIFFDDIRKEEWTPSYAGGSSRVDFILKNEGIVVEVKKTRENLTDRVLGEQLIVDIEKYKTHPDCKQLICFVYDPEGLLGNPQGIMNDLNKTHEGFTQVIIKPD